MTLKAKHESLQTILRDLGRVVVAYSGGVDSSYLLKAAADTLGARNVLACISMGPSEPGSMCEKARDVARDIGVELMIVEAGELEDPNFAANNADRCFHCKSHLCQTLLDIANQRGFPHVIFGTNFDDLDDYRPGNKATKVFGVRSPLAEAGLTKDEIRQLSREAGLATADQPASPCLASRIPYGLEVTEQRLRQIDQAEDVLRSLGFVECRVRHHDKIARIEVRRQDVARLLAEPVRSTIVEKLKALGFQFVTADLQGFRSGSLNESLSDEQKKAGLKS
jgi:pyridinium-3,5-biscarboxylic acid mononucleotide sulfurtransferase